ncbi:hypothetical protein PYW08_008411 [Mythimna loreyi]|uniref:Uncharacterized protein n=1 Tax=Mythimna loreyi TaxID=667449 RepID=A0ACC2QDB1_9NEOP|nr:hypothetical protein PYW08_008411 [Mythimna loreyi]
MRVAPVSILVALYKKELRIVHDTQRAPAEVVVLRVAATAISGFLCLRGARPAGARGAGGARRAGAGRGAAGAACRSRSRAAGGGRARRVLRVSLLTGAGLQAPLLQLDEARRLQQRVEQAHGLAAGGARCGAAAVTPRLATRAAAHVAARRAPMAARRARHVTAPPSQWARASAARGGRGAARSMPLQRSNACPRPQPVTRHTLALFI